MKFITDLICSFYGAISILAIAGSLAYIWSGIGALIAEKIRINNRFLKKQNRNYAKMVNNLINHIR